MNHIKKLEIYGFKSFSGRKELIFPMGLNCIMGPNGSGKSNVTEAICFVLGKASRKDLRAERLGDLVYNGGKKLAPSKFAKVTIVLDNKNRKFPIDEDEIKISRKVDREGRSLFRVNGKRETREYVKNLLAHANIDPDGYNIVMQGEIEKFIDLSTEERRKIIEDLAGISIYEEKKHKCLLELEKVEQKLKEANIVLSEKVKHMEELKKEKEQAENYERLQRELRIKKASKLMKEMQQLIEEKNHIDNKLKRKEEEIEKETQAKNKVSEKINQLNNVIEDINKKTQELGETEQIELNNQIEQLKIKLNELSSETKSFQNELKRIELRKQQIKKDVEINEENLIKIKSQKEELKSKIQEKTKALTELKEKQKKLANLDKERMTALSKIAELEKEVIELKSEFERLKEKQKELEEKEKLKKELEEKNTFLSEKTKIYETLLSELKKLKDEREKTSNELHKLKAKKDALLGLLKRGTRAILELKKSKKVKGIIGAVYELGKAKEEYSLPLKVAAGEKINAIVVENEDVAKECIDYLRKNKLGIATFLPLNRIKPKAENTTLSCDCIIDFAINLIEFDKKYENIFKYIFSNTVIVKDIESAKKVGINKVRMVTLDGDLIEKSGAIVGGYRKQTVGFDIETVNSKIKDVEKRLKQTIEKISEFESKKEKLIEEMTKVRSEIYHIEAQISKIKDFDVTRINKVEKEIGEKIKQKEKYEEYLKNLPRKIHEEELNKLNSKIEKLQEEINTLSAKLKGISFEEEITKRDLERAKKIIVDLDKDFTTFSKKIKENEKELKECQRELEKKLSEEKKFHAKLRELYEKRNNIINKVKELEIKKVEIENKIEKLRSEWQEIKLKAAEISAKMEGKKTALEEFKDIEIKEVKESVQKLEKEIEALEKKISSFGAVNLRALEVYKEVEKEYKELKEKVDRLTSEKNEILNAMNEIEEKKRDTFLETFYHVAKNFERVFSVLSPNGEGKLILENEDNPFEGGVDIIARPGGKKFISLRAMSGGEKTITTLAFIFAVQEYSPSPFYIMDEVDAALDKENSEKLGQLLKEYSKTSQFIVVSHNDSIIAQADNLYGVHMNELGESQIVSIKLPEK
ncbi:MAG: chromosome segregation protein SMC [Nanoarchaeota archaeon]|nr:chromosome segregation protein SMC [Nanoarchaeota archaeon]